MLFDCITMGLKAKHFVLGDDVLTWLRSYVRDDLQLFKANIFLFDI